MRTQPRLKPATERQPDRVPHARLALLVPVFNEQRGLERSLDSLRREVAQFEVMVVDDGSVPPISIPDTLPYRVTLIRLADNRGISAALNAGLERIINEGFEYVGRLDAGDISLPGRFAAQIAFLDRNPEHAVVGTQAEVVDEEGRHLYMFRPPTDHEHLTRQLHYRNPMCHPSVMIRTV
jgi:glycosyltransferase involved in cell wall biosynthesis